MTKTADALLRDALELGEQDRADMAAALLESLEPAVDEAAIAQAWDEEVQRRVAEIDSGQAELIPWEEVRRQLFSRLNERS
ncbi:MAG TPA: addiction module protein [Thermoanaerobaculia bacterium]|nr:addiction module protein [Thermoanaerobaculia bacterium]HXT50451.1 addiction module protein [Thermoanaerobaculia bacterium]